MAAAILTGLEIFVAEVSGRKLASPSQDLALVSMAGASVAFLAALVALPWRRRISGAGIVAGLGVGLLAWLPTVSGGTLLEGPRLVRSVIFGGALVILSGILGQFIGTWIASRVGGKRPFVVDFLLLALLAAPFLQSRIAGISHGDDRPNVLLLTIDTLRADRVGFNGCADPLSPTLDRWARRGTVYARAITPQPRTLPGLASLMTGGLPTTHGVRDNFHYTLGEASTTLAEILQSEGWATGAVNSNPVLSHDSGIYQGFDSANDRGDDWSRVTLVRGTLRIWTLLRMRTGDRDLVISELAIHWLKSRPKARPYFLWVHYLAPHVPYEPNPRFAHRFDPQYEGDYALHFDYGSVSKGEMTYKNNLDPRTLQHVSRLYDAEVATSDRAVQSLLRWMELAGELENTMVVLTADHGESLTEHGYYFNHGDFVYGPAANVPLVCVFPVRNEATEGDAPTFEVAPPVSETASLVDVAPTILNATRLRPNEVTFDGVSLGSSPRLQFIESDFCRFPDLNSKLGYLLPVEVAQDPGAIPEWKSKWEAQAIMAKQRAVIAGPWKLVLSPHPEGDRLELFHLATDPAEAVDVAAAHPAVVKDLEPTLRRWIQAAASQSSSAGQRILTEETRARMEALGYLGR